MTNRILPRDLSGNIILPGSITKTLSEDFLTSSALPSWLFAASGTPTFQNMAVERGQVTMTTSGTTGSNTELRTSQLIDLTKVEAVMWTVEGFYADASAGINLYFGISNAGNGAYCAATPNPVLKVSSGDTGTAVRDDFLSNNEWGRRKSRSFLINCQTKHAYVLEHGQVIADVDLSAKIVLGPAYPSINLVQATGTIARNLRIGRVSLTVSTY